MLLEQFKERVLQRFDNQFGLSGLQSKPLSYANITDDEYDKVKLFVSNLIDEFEKAIPEKREKVNGYYDDVDNIRLDQGINACREEIINNLK